MSDTAVAARRVAVLQSNYLPWKGYFDIINDVDLFVFYDDVQFTKNDWRNRNKIKSLNGPEWFSIPVGQASDRLVCEVEIPASTWQIKHWKTLQQNYGRCAHFTRFKGYFEHVYLDCRWSSLSTLNQALIRHVAQEFLGIKSEFHDSSQYAVNGRKLDRLLALVQMTGATQYVSGPAAKDYIDLERFDALGVEVEWKDYSGYPEYPQRFPPFAHGVSIVDLLFNVGPDAPWFIWGWRLGGRRPGAGIE